MNVLILGSGGREHTFAWKIAQSRLLENLYIAPGNAGTAHCGTNVNIGVNDFEAIKSFVWEKSIDMVLVGPEDPLVKGIHDFFLQDEVLKDVSVIGPVKAGALLEGSKDYSKQFMQRHGVPTARYASFTKDNLADGKAFLKTLAPPYVLKADGLAAGKGVLILNDYQEACMELDNMLLQSKFGNASATVVIEEFLKGIEASVFVLTDGKNYKLLPEAKDYKRIGEGDTGLNTGGMGAVSPVPFFDAALWEKIETRVVKPTVEGLIKDGVEYKGFIFIGLMINAGEPFVIEYNCRMGDPETEVVIPRIKSDFLEVLSTVQDQKLNEIQFELHPETATTVMLVSGGYPEDYSKHKVMSGFEALKDVHPFHAGTIEQDGAVLTNGGRVLALTAIAHSIEAAVSKSLAAAETISYENKYYRKDIGLDLMKIKRG
jgi:phosphoribosylamine---glycine ligase